MLKHGSAAAPVGAGSRMLFCEVLLWGKGLRDSLYVCKKPYCSVSTQACACEDRVESPFRASRSSQSLRRLLERRKKVL
jgi:hypothetical protein